MFTANETEITAILEQSGIQPTAQRVKIAAIMLAAPQHLSADDILGKVNAAGAAVSKATVYNTLGLFADKGLLRQVIVDPTRVFYDSNTGPHHHFFNQDTGELTDIDSDRLEVGTLPDLPAETEMAGVDVIIRVRNSR